MPLYDHNIKLTPLMTPERIEAEIAQIKANTEKAEGITLREVRRVRTEIAGDAFLCVEWEAVEEALAPYAPQPQAQPPAFVDNLQAKRQRQAFIDSQFTREQQKALGMILETWWGMKMAGIETQRVAQAVEEHPRRLNALEADVEALKARVGHYLP